VHESGNIFIYAPNQKVLMLVDVIFPGWTPFKDLAMAQDVPEFIAAHDKVLEYDFDTFIEDISHAWELLRMLKFKKNTFWTFKLVPQKQIMKSPLCQSDKKLDLQIHG
jgi:hypothetical protein